MPFTWVNPHNRQAAPSGPYCDGGTIPFKMTVDPWLDAGTSGIGNFRLVGHVHFQIGGGGYSGPNLYDFDIDWGDGNWDFNVTSASLGVPPDITHTYAVPGTYQISIYRNFPAIHSAATLDSRKITSIDQWGNICWRSMYRAFKNCLNMELLATDIPNFSNIISVGYDSNWEEAFMNCASMVGNPSMNLWDMSTATNLVATFRSCVVFDQNIGNWDVSNVTIFGRVTGGSDFRGMFYSATSFNNGGSDSIRNWNTSSAVDMQWMFFQASSFNQPLDGWDVSNVTNMYLMFRLATTFNQDLGNWTIASLTNAAFMLYQTGLSTANYDNLLVGWTGWTLGAPTKPFQNGVPLRLDPIKYSCPPSDASDARTYLVATAGWTIIDGGCI